MWGLDLKQKFLDLEYELFLDRQTSRAHLAHVVLFGKDDSIFKQLKGNADIIQTGNFLHYFKLKQLYKACEKIVAVLKSEKGVFNVGQQFGRVKPDSMLVREETVIYKHNPEAFEKEKKKEKKESKAVRQKISTS